MDQQLEPQPIKTITDLRGKQASRIPLSGQDVWKYANPEEEGPFVIQNSQGYGMEGWQEAFLTNANTWERLRVERNLITAHFIEDIWARVHKIRKDSAAQSQNKNSPYAEIESFFTKKDDPVSLPDIKDATLKTFYQAVNQWQYEMEARIQNPKETWDEDERLFNRLTNLITFGHRAGITDFDIKTPGDFIGQGAATATESVFNLFDVIPKVFQEKYGRLPTINEMDALMQSTKTLVLHFAIGSIDLVIPFLRFLRVNGNPNQKTWNPNTSMNPDMFDIEAREISTSGQHSFKLVIKEETFTEFAKTIADERTQTYEETLMDLQTQVKKVITGCPAVTADAKDPITGIGQNVVTEYYNWCFAIAKQYYKDKLPERRVQKEE